MNSFLLITKSDRFNGNIVFVSKHISSLLDYSQVRRFAFRFFFSRSLKRFFFVDFLDFEQDDVLNRSIFEFISSRDQHRIKEYLHQQHPSIAFSSQRTIFSFCSMNFSVLNRCSVGWKRSTSNEFEQCSIIGAFRSGRSF